MTRVLIASAAALLAAAPAALRAQTGPCRGVDSTGTQVLDGVRFLLNAQDPDVAAARDTLGLPAVPASQAVLVTKNTTCQRAADAYRQHVVGPASRLSGRVYVVQAGTTYTVVDPTYYYSRPGDRLHMTFDSRWRLIAKW